MAATAPMLRRDVGSPVSSVAVSYDGTRIASGSADCLVRIWDVRTMALALQPMKGHTDWVRSVAWSLDNTRVISGSSDNTIRIWDVRTGAPVGRPLEAHTSVVFSVALSPNGAYLVSASYDKTIRLWDIYTGIPRGGPFIGHNLTVLSVAFSPDSMRIGSGSSDCTIRIWDVTTGASMGQPLRGHTASVLAVAFSPDNMYIVSGSVDGTVRVWDAQNGAPIGKPFSGHTCAVLSVGFSPDSSLIISSSKDSTVRVWNARTGAPKGPPLKGHTSTVYSVGFSHDGSHVVSGSGDGSICVWVAPPGIPSFDKVTSDMSNEQIFECLVQHGCTDLSSFLINGQYSSLPIENGGFGDVWRVKLTGRPLGGISLLAVKTLRLKALLEKNDKAAKRAAREVYNWSTLRHPNVQELLGIVVYQGALGMVSAWREHGHLKDYLSRHPEVARYPLCIQLASGVSHLHSVDMVHGDLKANNVLVSDDGTLKINDFDHAVLAESTLRFSTTTRAGGGTLRWMAPELLQSEDEEEEEETLLDAVRSKETDVYALGMTMLEIMSGNVPYHEYTHDMGVYHAIHTRIPPRRPQQLSEPDTRTAAMWGLLMRCWDHNPSARPQANTVLASLQSFAA